MTKNSGPLTQGSIASQYRVSNTDSGGQGRRYTNKVVVPLTDSFCQQKLRK